jgi:hypothetical protein
VLCGGYDWCPWETRHGSKSQDVYSHPGSSSTAAYPWILPVIALYSSSPHLNSTAVYALYPLRTDSDQLNLKHSDVLHSVLPAELCLGEIEDKLGLEVL